MIDQLHVHTYRTHQADQRVTGGVVILGKFIILHLGRPEDYLYMIDILELLLKICLVPLYSVQYA